jgi:hypothetical protein
MPSFAVGVGMKNEIGWPADQIERRRVADLIP